MGHLGHLSRPGHRVIILTRCENRVFRVSEKNAQNANVHLKCWNDKSHCQVSVVGPKSLVHAMNFYFYLWLLKIIWPENTSSHISRHLEFVIEQGHRVNWVSGSLDSRISGSLGQFHLWCLCLSVCHKLVFCRNGWTNWAVFWRRRFFPSILHCFKEMQIFSKIRVPPCGTLLHTLDLENFATACRSSKHFIKLARETWTLRAW